MTKTLLPSTFFIFLLQTQNSFCELETPLKQLHDNKQVLIFDPHDGIYKIQASQNTKTLKQTPKEDVQTPEVLKYDFSHIDFEKKKVKDSNPRKVRTPPLLPRYKKIKAQRKRLLSSKLYNSFLQSFKKDWSLSLEYLGDQALRSDISPGIDLDLRALQTSLDKRFIHYKGFELHAGYGIAYAQFGYDHRSYIFKTGPDPFHKFRFSFQHDLSANWALSISHLYARYDLDGDEFENKIDSRQGEYKAFEMNMKQEFSSIELKRKFNIKQRPFTFGVQGFEQKHKVDMEIGWRSNLPEQMLHRKSTGYQIRLSGKPFLYRKLQPINMQLDYHQHSKFKFSMLYSFHF